MSHFPQIGAAALGYRAFQVIAYVHEYHSQHGISPSYSMIRDKLGFLSNSDVRKVVVRMERRGLLRRAGSGRVRRIVLNAH